MALRGLNSYICDMAKTETKSGVEAGAKAGSKAGKTLLIACGALAREVVALKQAHGWQTMDVTCLPAIWHNRPEKIPEGVRRKIRAGRKTHERIFVAYGDCGTGGVLDKVLAEEGVERIDGPHCYQFYMGTKDFEALMEREPTTFFLTDYLARHFDRLIIQGLGLDRHPELRDDYFGNYRKLVYLAQIEDPNLKAKAKQAARRLGLEFDYRLTAYGELGDFIDKAMKEEARHGAANRRLLA
jgi:hypothetical protein